MLKGQFGGGVGHMYHFRAKFLGHLELAMAVYRDAKVEVTERGLTLSPSKPPVAPKMIAVSRGTDDGITKDQGRRITKDQTDSTELFGRVVPFDRRW
jgi:hypothetical protein